MKKRETIAQVLRYLGHYKIYLVISLVLATISVIFTLYVPILVGKAIDLIVEPGNVNFDGLVPLLIRAAVLILLTAVATWLMSAINNRITFHVVQDVRREAFDHITRLPLSYLDTHSTGDIVSRVIADVDQFADGLLMGFTQFFTGIMTIVGTLICMLTISPLITLVVVVLTPLSLFVAKFIATKTYKMFELQSVTRGQQTAVIEEMIGNQKIVQAFSHEDEALAQFDEVNERLCDCSLQATFFSSLTNPSTRFVNSMVYAACTLVGALLVIRGGLSVGGLSALLNYAGQYAKPFNEISSVITELQNALACAGRVMELILREIPEEVLSIPEPEVSTDSQVSFKDVAFSYVPERPLISGLNLEVENGQRIAIVGPTGCGKTTLINLLMRFYEVKEGSIAVDGKDIRNMTKHSLRKNYGMVLQETWLMEGTIRENIIMGKPDATEEEMIAAAKASHAHSFIKRLPDGYNTVLSEGGGELSAGQRQLLCITRVMLCLPDILILDEATSSIDTRTELKIQDAFSTLMNGRTSFIVAHRLSTIKNADRILVMKDGNIIEQGTHDQLMQAGGFYRTLYLAGSAAQ